MGCSAQREGGASHGEEGTGRDERRRTTHALRMVAVAGQGGVHLHAPTQRYLPGQQPAALSRLTMGGSGLCSRGGDGFALRPYVSTFEVPHSRIGQYCRSRTKWSLCNVRVASRATYTTTYYDQTPKGPTTTTPGQPMLPGLAG